MCGIAGIVTPFLSGLESRAVYGAASEPLTAALPGSSVVAMGGCLRHRGPDAQGTWQTTAGPWEIAFAHTRLRILDLSDAAHQPMVDESSGCVLVFNGEIYNFAALRNELLAADGMPFRSTGDTEVLLRAYLRWGVACVGRLRGMFAFALYDPRARRLFLGRDHFGIKPLYITMDGCGRFAFASEVRALLSLPWVGRKLDLMGLLGYMAYGSVQDPYTMVAGIQAIPAGHTLTVNLADTMLDIADPVPFWALPYPDRALARLSPGGAAEQVRHALTDAVRLHMVSDVPVGVFLSGGIDSSAVVALMAETSSAPIHTLNVSFDEAGFDESAVAQAVAQRYGTEHTTIRLTAQDFLHDIQPWLASQDQPSMDGANSWIVSRACKQTGLTVALSGLGGDELFAGYPTFHRTARAARLFRFIEWLPEMVRARLVLAILAWKGTALPVQKVSEWIASDGSSLSTYLILRRLFMPSLCQQLLAPWVNAMSHPAALHPAVLQQLQRYATTPDVIAAVSLFEIHTYLTNTLLRDTDQMSMAHSIEVRVPFVDREVAELVLRLPGALRLSGGGAKPLLCAAMEGRLDRAWIDRPKMTFSFPFDQWLRGPLREEVEQGLSQLPEALFKRETIWHLWRQFLRGRPVVNSGRFMTLYALAAWMQRYAIEAV